MAPPDQEPGQDEPRPPQENQTKPQHQVSGALKGGQAEHHERERRRMTT
jgi:hypothetical protein